MNISYTFAHPTFKAAGGCVVGRGGNPTTKKPGLHRPLHRFSKSLETISFSFMGQEL
jgi:hypothetical protein